MQLSAGHDISPNLNAYADRIFVALLPALEETALRQVEAAYGGISRTSTAGLNSSITIPAKDEMPGTAVTALHINGADVMATHAKLNDVKPSGSSFRLHPANLRSQSGQGSRRAFRGVYQAKDAFADAGTATSITWMGVNGTGADALTYGSEASDRLCSSWERMDERRMWRSQACGPL